MSTTVGELIGANVGNQNRTLDEARAIKDKILAALILRTEEDLEQLDDEKLAGLIMDLQAKKWSMRNLRIEARNLAALK